MSKLVPDEGHPIDIDQSGVNFHLLGSRTSVRHAYRSILKAGLSHRVVGITAVRVEPILSNAAKSSNWRNAAG